MCACKIKFAVQNKLSFLSLQFNKTGIVICESGKVHKVLAMSFSVAGLHAVQQIVRCLPSSLRDSTVYLSRKPCRTCTTFLIQGI